MGDHLGVIDLGSDFVGKIASCGYNHCCILSTENHMKCWGTGGNLGYEDTVCRNGEPGSNLQFIDLGNDFEIQDFLLFAESALVQSTNGDFKAFGMNDFGQLGYGDTNRRGDGIFNDIEMGDALPFIDIGSGFTASGVHMMSGAAPDGRHVCVCEESSSDLLLKC